MTIEQKLDEKLERLDVLDGELEVWLKYYHGGTIFPESPEMNSNTYKLNIVKEIVAEMLEAADHAEILSEVMEAMKEC